MHHVLPILYIYFLGAWPSQQAMLEDSSTIPYVVHNALFGKPASSVSMVIDCLPSWMKYHRNCSGNFPASRRRQASLIKGAQYGVSHHSTWSSRTSCGGINPYTLMAWYRPHHRRWPHPRDEDVRRTTLIGVHHKATRRYCIKYNTLLVALSLHSI